ncbi:MAG: YfhO family protein [Oligoflexia bacterium]|nr:YfhO family protein [Oligoflexia bacterium]
MFAKIKQSHLYLFIALVVALLMIIYRPFFFHRHLHLYNDVGIDSIQQTLPFIAHLADALRAGEWSSLLWSFKSGIGQQTYLLFPVEFTDPFNLLWALFGKEQVASMWIYIHSLRILATSVLFYLYLLELGLNFFARTIFSLLFSFSGYMFLLSLWPSLVLIPTYFALMLLGVEKFFKHKNIFLLPLAIFLISIVQAIYCYYFLLLLLLYLFARTACTSSSSWRQSFTALFLWGMGALSSAIVSLPVLMHELSGARASTSSIFQKIIHEPLTTIVTPLEVYTVFFRLFSTDFLGKSFAYQGAGNYIGAPVLYTGVATLILCLLCFFNSSWRQKVVYFTLLLVALMLLLHPYTRLLFHAFAGPYYRHTYWVNFALLFCAIAGFKRLEQKELPHKFTPLIVATLIIALLLLVSFTHTSSASFVNKSILINVTLLLALYGTLFSFWHQFPRTSKILFTLLLLFELCDFSYKSSFYKRGVLPYEDYHNPQFGYIEEDTGAAIAYLKATDKQFYRMEKLYFSASPNDSMYQNYYGSKAYYSFTQKSYIDFLSELNDKPLHIIWLEGPDKRAINDLLGIKYFLSKGALSESSSKGMQLLTSIHQTYIYKNLQARPLGFTYDLNAAISKEQFLALSKEDRATTLLAHFVPEQDLAALSPASPPSGSASLEISSFSHRHLHGSINSTGPALLFLSIPYDAGWKATVNGEEVPLLKVNLGLTGILLQESGLKQIHMSFLPRYFALGALLSLLGIVAFTLFAYFYLYSYSRYNKSKTSPISRSLL